ncbi:hypothetical protein ACFWFF_29155 [Streptomyces sp. NPDC060223]|uniref:hypothetical protein n=1 Tax=unclassified Streptomyces TaxID=2593676 RepID=UPI00362C8E23
MFSQEGCLVLVGEEELRAVHQPTDLFAFEPGQLLGGIGRHGDAQSVGRRGVPQHRRHPRQQTADLVRELLPETRTEDAGRRRMRYGISRYSSTAVRASVKVSAWCSRLTAL